MSAMGSGESGRSAAERRAAELRASELRAAAVRVVVRLREAGHSAYLAGGCVRDELLGVVPKDYDVATDARPERVEALFAPRTSAVGAAFGVVLVKDRGCVTEVATFRADGPYSDKRRPDHIVFATAEEDARRRDFTINAMFLDPLAEGEAGRVIDYVGGRADARARVLRAVGDAGRRLAEDHLRALRAVRFAARYELEVEAGTAGAIREHAAELAGVSRERIGEELRRMLASGTRGRAVALMEELGLTGPATGCVLGRGVSEVSGAGALVVGELQGGEVGEGASVALGLAAWACGGEGGVLGEERAEEVARGLRAALMLSNEEASALRGVLASARGLMAADGADGGAETGSVAGRKRVHASAHAAAAMELVRGLSRAGLTPGAWDRAAAERARLEADGVGIAPAALVDGDALVAAGFVPGPGFARVLAEVYDAQLEGRVRTAEEAMRGAGESAARLGLRRG